MDAQEAEEEEEEEVRRPWRGMGRCWGEEEEEEEEKEEEGGWVENGA